MTIALCGHILDHQYDFGPVWDLIELLPPIQPHCQLHPAYPCVLLVHCACTCISTYSTCSNYGPGCVPIAPLSIYSTCPNYGPGCVPIAPLSIYSTCLNHGHVSLIVLLSIYSTYPCLNLCNVGPVCIPVVPMCVPIVCVFVSLLFCQPVN